MLNVFARNNWSEAREGTRTETTDRDRPSFERFLAEPAFLHTVRLEREIAVRSLQQVVLMLVDVDGLPSMVDGPAVFRRITGALLGVIREIDPCGWYKERSIVGVIFTEIGSPERQSVQEAISSRVWSALRRELAKEQWERIRISFEFFPANDEGQSPSTPLSPKMYPDLFRQNTRKRLSQAAKRIMDVAGSLTALILLSPVLAAIGLAIKLTSKGPALYRQTRIGLYGIPFTFLKFRSMHVQNDTKIHEDYIKEFIAGNINSEPAKGNTAAVYKITSDPRVTPFGRFLRKTSLDELPQFWNVLVGQMSLVGPRPPTSYEIDHYKSWHWRRLFEVKPGITGLWQINGRSRTTFDDMVRLDLQYARTRSLWLDLKILLRTPGAVFSGEGAY